MAESPTGLASTTSFSLSPSPWGPPSPSLDACSPSLGAPSVRGPPSAGMGQSTFKTALGYASRLSRNPHKGPVGVPEEREDAESFTAKSALLLQGLQQHLQQEVREEGEGVVVHTGAGISTSAGIPDFRGPSGVWTLEKRGQTLADVEANIVQVSFGRQKRPVVPFHLALPTPTHLILRALTQHQHLLLAQPKHQHQQQQHANGLLGSKKEEQHQQTQQQNACRSGASASSEALPQAGSEGPQKAPEEAGKGGEEGGDRPRGVRLIDYIITQNVDALHARCGVPLERLGEVHGNMFIERCDNCARRFLRDFALPTLSFRPTGRLCDSVLQEIAKGLGLRPGWGWSTSTTNASSTGGRWGSTGSCDPQGFEADPIPFHFGEFARTALVFVLRLPTNALPPDMQQHQQQQKEDLHPQQPQEEEQKEQQQHQVGQQQHKQQREQPSEEQLPCGVQGPDDPWAERLAWLPQRAAPTAGTPATEQELETVHQQNGCGPRDSPQTFLVAAACGTSLEVDASSSSCRSSTYGSCSSGMNIEYVDSLRGLWKVTTSCDCSLRLHLWYGSSALLHLNYSPKTRGMEADVWQVLLACTPNTHASSLPPSISPRAPAAARPALQTATATAATQTTTAPSADAWGCVSCLPSSSVCLVPPYEPRWPKGRMIRRSRLVALLTPRRCTAETFDAVSAREDGDTGRGNGVELSESKEWEVPPSLVSLYLLQRAAALAPMQVLHAALMKQQRPVTPRPLSPCFSPVGPALSPTEGPPVTPTVPSTTAAASAVFAAENSTGSSISVERRYPLRRSRQLWVPSTQGPPKRRRGGGSGGPRGPLSTAKIPAVRLPTEEEETRLPYIPLQLADSFRYEDARHAVGEAGAAMRCRCCGSSSCGSPVLLLAADWELGSLVVSVPAGIKPTKRYARLLQRGAKQQQQEPVDERVARVATLLLQQLYTTSRSVYNPEEEEKEGRVMAGAFTWGALRGLPIWTLHYLQDLLECM